MRLTPEEAAERIAAAWEERIVSTVANCPVCETPFRKRIQSNAYLPFLPQKEQLICACIGKEPLK